MSASTDESSRRTYQSPRRQAAAQETRARIRSAAETLFLNDGYSATSMRTIARAAGVAEKTVYLQFATKSMLLKEVVETAIVGDAEAIPAAERDWFQDVLRQPDLAQKLRQLAAATVALHERSGAVFAMARSAAATDPDAAALWAFGKRGHLADMTILAGNFAARAQLPDGADEAWATTTLYVLIGLEAWHLVRVELGQSESSYHDWLLMNLGQAFNAQLGR